MKYEKCKSRACADGRVESIARLVAVAAITALAAVPARAELPPSSANEQTESLIRVWSSVRVAHPWVAEDLSGWDQAFVDASEQILESGSCNTFESALTNMLSSLEDPATRLAKVAIAAESNSQPVTPERATKPAVKWLDDQTAIIEITDWLGLTIGAGGLNAMHSPMFADAFADAANAELLILNLRRSDSPGLGAGFDSGAFMISATLRRELPKVTSESLVMPTTASRQHYGYSNQGITSEFYHSGLYIRDHKVVDPAGTGTGRPESIAIWTNEPESASHQAVIDVIAAVGDLKNGVVVSAAGGVSSVDPYAYPVPIPSACELVAQVRTSVMVNPDGSTGFSPTTSVAPEASEDAWLGATINSLEADIKETSANDRKFPLAAESEPKHAEMRNLSVGNRLLGLAKFWSAFHYYSPYRNLTDKPWDSVLAEYIPRFIAASSDLEYAKAVTELAVETNDSHTQVTSPQLSEYLGSATIPLVAREVEGQSVIVWAGDEPAVHDVSPGDVVLSIDGNSVEHRMSELLALTPGSNEAARIRNAHARMFFGQPGSVATVTLKGNDGRLKELTTQRSYDAVGRWDLYSALKPADAAGVVSENIGYIDIPRIGATDLDGAIQSIAGARDIVFDMRGYPNVPVTEFLVRLSSSTGVGAKITVPIVRSIAQDSEYQRGFEANVCRRRRLADSWQRGRSGESVDAKCG